MACSFYTRRVLKSLLSRTSTLNFVAGDAYARKLAIGADEQNIALVYSEHGDPGKVLKCKVEPQPTVIKEDEVVVRMLAAPVNPADINMIQGVYPVRPKLPAVGGNEGVGQVVEVGRSVSHLKPGDWVVPAVSGWGTWRTLAVSSSRDIVKIPNNIPVVSAATLAVNPCTAYRMLVDFASLKPGECIIQNGANSGVGQAVIQIAAQMSLQTINAIRASRPNLDQLVTRLKSMGATHVVTDEYLRSPEMKEIIKSLPGGPPKLALNCVGGRSSADLLKYLARGAIVVTYGGMSKQPMSVPAGPLIFNDIQLRGYWNTRWYSDNQNSDKATTMWTFLSEMIQKGQLKAPIHRLVQLKDFSTAIDRAMEPLLTEKQILVFNETVLRK